MHIKSNKKMHTFSILFDFNLSLILFFEVEAKIEKNTRSFIKKRSFSKMIFFRFVFKGSFFVFSKLKLNGSFSKTIVFFQKIKRSFSEKILTKRLFLDRF